MAQGAPLDQTILASVRGMLARYGHGRQHRGLTGGGREEALRRILRGLLPNRFGVATGEVAATDRSVSSAMDIIIYDALETPLLDDDGVSIVVPVEGVYAVIEVASHLDEGKLADDITKIRSVKDMSKVAYYPTLRSPLIPLREGEPPVEGFPVLGFAFGYDSVSLEKLVEADKKIADPHDLRRGFDLICSLQHGLIVNEQAMGVDDPSRWYSAVPGTMTRRRPLDLPDDLSPEDRAAEAFGWFYVLLADALHLARTAPIRALDYWRPFEIVEFDPENFDPAEFGLE